MKDAFLGKIVDHSAVVAVVGLGYVGLPLALRFAECGFKVVGIDTDAERVAQLARGETYIERYGRDRIKGVLKKTFFPTTAFSEISGVDAILICVPTPLGPKREPDLSYVRAAADAMLPYLHSGQLISLESTTYPGTTEEEIVPRVKSKNLIPGKNIFVCFSPEREDPGNEKFPTHAIPKVLGGTTAACLEAGQALYGAAIERVVAVSSTRTAEMVKLLENVHRAVNIGLANEMKIICDAMGIDVHEVIRAAATKPFGFVPYWPGPGLGGHCIPIDPFYLAWKARAYGVHTRFIELAGEINSNMPHWVLRQPLPRPRRCLQEKRRRPARVTGAGADAAARGRGRDDRVQRPARARDPPPGARRGSGAQRSSERGAAAQAGRGVGGYGSRFI